jgi:hypothetical protein
VPLSAFKVPEIKVPAPVEVFTFSVFNVPLKNKPSPSSSFTKVPLKLPLVVVKVEPVPKDTFPVYETLEPLDKDSVPPFEASKVIVPSK